MGLRDILLFLFVFCAIPFIIRRPWIGVLFWVWFGLANPHLMTFGPAQSFPFAALIAIVTLAGMAFSPKTMQVKKRPALLALLLLAAWMTMTTFFAFNPAGAWPAWDRAMKVFLMTFVATLLINDRRQLVWFVGTIAISLGYFGTKGGLFTLRTGGHGMVFASGGFLSENNATGLAILMAIPLLWFFLQQAKRLWQKSFIAVSIMLSAAAVLGTQSRGAFLAICAIGLFLILKSAHRIALAIALVCVASSLVLFMPQTWSDRMETIETYQKDSSAMGRIAAWRMVTKLAADRPLIGGGFECYTPDVYARYGEGGDSILAAHSIYFQVLGEHGYIALLLFLAVWLFTWRDATATIRAASKRDDLLWAADLCRMLQVSLVGYLVGGAFLSLANWDLPYYLMVGVVVARSIVEREVDADGTVAVSAESTRFRPDAPHLSQRDPVR
ncbi:MAG TPA: putative O-glycosylation ligase, exosortase A system-associated [Casimicrobiaceae bacterium]|nr:putative O-glycosylation ligase, exosortase A system-associated [Casimicrobiaceae bacterium]